MPHSRKEGKDWIKARILELHPLTILDVGVGAGTYWELLKDTQTIWWTGIEVFAPYVNQFGLRQKYDEVIIGNFIHPSIQPPRHDVVILGDVLEHVSKEEGVFMWEKARSLADKAVMLVLPIDHFEQGEVNGNTYERHLYHWEFDEVIEELDGIMDCWEGTKKGCFVGRPTWMDGTAQ